MIRNKNCVKKELKTNIICCIISFFALSLVFLAGTFYSDTRTEKIADYASNVVKNKTVNGKYCCLSIEKGENVGSLPAHDNEFFNLYGVFKQERITFASCINADKQHVVELPYENSSNLSFFYLGPVGTIQYKGHFKHYIYPIETMFTFADVRAVSKNEVSISQSHADKILEQNGIQPIEGEYSRNQYESLLKQKIFIKIDGETYDFGIQNIYLENNYYVEGLHDVMGDFLLSSYYLPANLHLERQNLYFLNEYTYQNKYFMSYINNVYDSGEYNLQVNRFNINGDINEDYLLSFYYSTFKAKYDWISTMLFIIAGLSLLVALILLVKNNKKRTLLLCHFISLLVPYLIFYFLSVIFKDTAFFSEISTKINAVSIVVFVTSYFIVSYVLSLKKRINSNILGTDYYEINI